MAARREGRGHEYLALKREVGRLHVDPTLEASILHSVEDWIRDVTAGADPATHVIVSDLNLVVNSANELAHQRLAASGQLSEPRVLLGPKEFAVGDRVSFVAKHVELVPRLGTDGEALQRRDGTPRMHALTTPRRTRGEVVGIDLAAAEGVTITVRTDDSGRLQARTVHLDAEQASRELDWGYAMTTAGSQGKTWEKTYGVWTGSRLSDLEQSYTATSRARQATIDYLNTEGVHAEASPEHTLEEQTIAEMAALISRSTAKSTTLDFGGSAPFEEPGQFVHSPPPQLAHSDGSMTMTRRAADISPAIRISPRDAEAPAAIHSPFGYPVDDARTAPAEATAAAECDSAGAAERESAEAGQPAVARSEPSEGSTASAEGDAGSADHLEKHVNAQAATDVDWPSEPDGVPPPPPMSEEEEEESLAWEAVEAYKEASASIWG